MSFINAAKTNAIEIASVVQKAEDGQQINFKVKKEIGNYLLQRQFLKCT